MHACFWLQVDEGAAPEKGADGQTHAAYYCALGCGETRWGLRSWIPWWGPVGSIRVQAPIKIYAKRWFAL